MHLAKMFGSGPLTRTPLALLLVRQYNHPLKCIGVRNLSHNIPGAAIERQVRNIYTNETKSTQKADSMFTKLLSKIPLINVQKNKIMAAGYLHYEGIADNVDYIEFFHELDLPDTFYSWFVVTELHIWMMSVRAMAEGDDGRLFRNGLVEALWSDVAARVKKLGASNPAVTRVQVSLLSEQFQAALIGYDEGLQTDDVVLAGTVWRRFFQYRYVDSRCLDQLVKYIRKQIMLLDNIPKEHLFENKAIHWDPLKK